MSLIVATKGKLSIDNREMLIDMKPGETKLLGLTQEEMEQTLGGIVAESLFGILSDVMQAWAIASETYSGETWQFIRR